MNNRILNALSGKSFEEIEKVFNEVGIALFNKDGTCKSMYEVFDELSVIWDSKTHEFRFNELEQELNDYINDLCAKENILIDIRFANFGDENLYYDREIGTFVNRYDHYHVCNISEMKQLIANTYLVRLWQHAKPNQEIALCIKDIVNTGNGYNITIGGQLFNS